MRPLYKKLGALIPSGNTTLEPEIWSLLPPGVSLHVARLKLRADTLEELQRMVDDLPVQVDRLLDAQPQAIAFGCTAGSFLEGTGYDRRIVDAVSAITDVPCTTTTTAVVSALKELGVERPAVFTPYPEWLTLREVDFLTGAGFKVVSHRCLGLEDGMNEVSPGEIYSIARSMDGPGVDGIFISCTDFPSLSVLPFLERDLGKPVVSSNQATLWMLFRLAGLDYRFNHSLLLDRI